MSSTSTSISASAPPSLGAPVQHASQFAAFWSKVRSAVILAVKSLWLHKLRAFLSVLGIIIGTAAVIALMAFGEGSMQDALEDIKRQGATNVIVRSVKPSDDSSSARRTFILRYGLTEQDYERMQMIEGIVGSVPMRIFPQEIRRLGRLVNGRVVATTENYQNVNKFNVVLGRFLRDADDLTADEGDDKRIRNVVVLGANIADTLFPFESPLGQAVVIGKHHYVVIGVIGERLATGTTTGGQAAEQYNNDIYMPLRTALGRFGEKIYIRQSGSRSGEQCELHQITLTCADMGKVRGVGDAVRDMLERYHWKRDWDVTVPLDRLEEAERARNRYTILLVLIASISLLVGGIGIMNIMLATVTERTREIGIRRALGAKRRDITLQFVIEAVVQTSLGGLLGVLVGVSLVVGLPFLANFIFSFSLPAQLSLFPILLSLCVSIGVGVLFGWYPAHRASRLDPIEALRHV